MTEAQQNYYEEVVFIPQSIADEAAKALNHAYAEHELYSAFGETLSVPEHEERYTKLSSEHLTAFMHNMSELKLAIRSHISKKKRD